MVKDMMPPTHAKGQVLGQSNQGSAGDDRPSKHYLVLNLWIHICT